jgi:uncharacterized membrane protein YvlD (DUF360 family)
MKHLLRIFIFHVFALWSVKEIYPGFTVSGGLTSVFIAGLVLSLLMLIAKPILKVLFLPINFITFGIAGLFINVVIIYLLTLLMPEIIIRSYNFPGFSWAGFVIPSVNLSYIWSLLIVSALVTVISQFLHDMSES